MPRNKDHATSPNGTPPAAGTGPFVVARLPQNRSVAFRIEPDAPARAKLAMTLDITSLRKLRFDGALHPLDGGGWELRAELGATVVQPCGITLAPVTTRMDELVVRRYLPDWQDPSDDAGAEGEVEIPEDTDTEPLGKAIDPVAVMTEALALALPAFPRAPGATLGPEGEAASADAASSSSERPFAKLAALRDRLADGAAAAPPKNGDEPDTH